MTIIHPVADKRRLLKIKLKSLAAEARIIRQEELKAKHSKRPEVQQLRAEMNLHRVCDLREEARATLLAYAYIRGKKYRDIEPRSDYTPMPAKDSYAVRLWMARKARIAAMVTKYGHDRGVRLDTWLSIEPIREKPPRKPKVPYTGPKGRLLPDEQQAAEQAAHVA